MTSGLPWRLKFSLIGLILAAGCQAATTDSTPTTPRTSPIPTDASATPSLAATTMPSPSPSPSPTPLLAVSVDGEILQVLADGLRLRSAPSTDAVVIGGLFAGQLLGATGESHVADGIAWLEVLQQPSGRTGWVAAVGPQGDPWIAVVRDGLIGITSSADVELIDPDSGERTPITAGMQVHDLAFAPDGRHVALLDPRHGPRVVAIDAVTAPDPTPVPSGPVYGPPAYCCTAFSPDGRAVAYLVGQDFLGLRVIWREDGDAPTFPLPATIFPFGWAPDSRRLAGAELVNIGSGEAENWEIVVAEAGQAQPRRLTNRNGPDLKPAWSPDGSTIAYLRDSGHGSTALAVMNADGSEQRTLLTFDGLPAFVAQPAWSPDGSRIAIAQQLEGWPAMIHLVDAHTSEHLSYGTPADRCEDLTWAPTGGRIAFVCGPADYSGPSSVYLVRLSEDTVADLGPGTRIDWARVLDPISIP